MPKRIRQAFLDTPRHLFAPRFYSSQKRQWIDLSKEALKEHLAELYADHPLCIYQDENGRSLSTISQPSLVLYMLDLLELQPGDSVFELGGGSAWNAALMGRLVGSTGRVTSIEIIESLASGAKAALANLKLTQVEFIPGDASSGGKNIASFDKGVFTASAWNVPSVFFDQIKQDGLLLFVLKAQANYDLLCLLRKTDSHTFKSEFLLTCSFVPVTGSSPIPEYNPISVNSLENIKLSSELDWADIKIPDTAISDFLEFAKLVFDCQQPYLLETHGATFDEEFWGIRDESANSLVIFNEDRIQLYGNEDCLITLRRTAKRWQKANKPSIEDLKLSIYRQGSAPIPSNDQWLSSRGESDLLWGV